MKYFFQSIVMLLMTPHFLTGQSKRTYTGFATIKVFDDGAKRGDTIVLRYYTSTLYNIPNVSGNCKELKATMGRDSLFYFKLPINDESGSFFLDRTTHKSDSVYLSSPSKFLTISGLYAPEKDDDILIKVNETKGLYFRSQLGGSYLFTTKLTFTGKGKAKYSIKEDLKRPSPFIKATAIFNDRSEYIADNSQEKQLEYKLKILASHMGELSLLQYNLLKAFVIYYWAPIVSKGTIEWVTKTKIANNSPEEKKLLNDTFREQYNKYIYHDRDYSIPVDALLKSNYYVPYTIKKASCDFLVNGLDKKSLYNYLKNRYKGTLRDEIITTFFLNPELSDGAANLEDINDAVKFVKTSYCLDRLQKILESGASSGVAYNFSMPDDKGKIINYTDFKGKVVLIDCWFTGCGSCLDYYKNDLSFIEEHFKNNPNVVFISVCQDQNKNVWLQSLKGGKYTSDLAINLYTEGLGSHHEFLKYYNVTGYPTPILIGKDGHIFSRDHGQLIDQKSAIPLIEEALKK